MVTSDDVQGEFQKYIDDNLLGWVNDTIVADMLDYARAMAMPLSFINHIRAVQEGNKVYIINDWRGQDYWTGSKNVPLAKFFEHGTRDHRIEPVRADALFWKVVHNPKFGPNHDVTVGEYTTTAFSKGHMVTGLRPRKPMHRGLRRGYVRLRERIVREFKDFHSSHQGVQFNVDNMFAERIVA